MATVNATYRWVESEARRVLREVLNAREKERRQEVTPPVARTRRARSEVSDDDEGDDDATTPTGLARAPRRKLKPTGAEAQMGPRHDVLAASRWRSSWEAGCQQLTAETGVNDLNKLINAYTCTV